MKHNYLLTALLSLLAVGSFAQTEVSVDIELVYQDDGTVPGYPTGYNTWRVYAVLESQDDFLSAIYGTMGDSPNLSVTTSTNHIWNSAVGHTSGAGIHPSAFVTDPASEYDSWITIGADDNTQGAIVNYLSILPTMTAFDDVFGVSGTTDEINGNLSVEDGAIFTLLDSSNGYPTDATNRVLIAQVTTDGDLTVCMNFQIFPGGISGELTEYDNYCDTESAPLSVEETALVPASLAPNPTAGNPVLTLDPTASQAQVTVHNLAGQIVWQGSATSQRTELPLDFLTEGVYLVSVQYGEADLRETLRLVKR